MVLIAIKGEFGGGMTLSLFYLAWRNEIIKRLETCRNCSFKFKCSQCPFFRFWSEKVIKWK